VSLIIISRVRPARHKGEGLVTRNQRNWAIRIGIFVVILVVIIIVTSH
jgi:hypothetical protein